MHKKLLKKSTWTLWLEQTMLKQTRNSLISKSCLIPTFCPRQEEKGNLKPVEKQEDGTSNPDRPRAQHPGDNSAQTFAFGHSPKVTGGLAVTWALSTRWKDEYFELRALPA